MRITRAEAEQNRQRILSAAARLFREKGFDGVGVADLMQAAGLTHGGFYNHFASKEELATAVCDLAFENAVAALEQTARDASRSEHDVAFAHYVAHYLSPEARDASAVRCPMVALANDAKRHGPAVRRRFATGIRRYIGAVGELLRGQSVRRSAIAEKRLRAEAITTTAMLVGGLLLARGVKDADAPLSDEILETLRNAIIAPQR